MNQAFDQALYDAVQRWARQIRAILAWIIEAILSTGTGEKLHAARQDLEPHGPKARAMPAAETRISRPAMSRLEAIGRHTAMLRRRTATLPPHVSTLYALISGRSSNWSVNSTKLALPSRLEPLPHVNR